MCKKLKEIWVLKPFPTVQALNLHNMQELWVCTKTGKNVQNEGSSLRNWLLELNFPSNRDYFSKPNLASFTYAQPLIFLLGLRNIRYRLKYFINHSHRIYFEITVCVITHKWLILEIHT